jgi:hypothetical protein
VLPELVLPSAQTLELGLHWMVLRVPDFLGYIAWTSVKYEVRSVEREA